VWARVRCCVGHIQAIEWGYEVHEVYLMLGESTAGVVQVWEGDLSEKAGRILRWEESMTKLWSMVSDLASGDDLGVVRI
jgi:hypothetical protein